MPLLSKASNVVQNGFFLTDVKYWLYSNTHSIPVATSCRSERGFRVQPLLCPGIMSKEGKMARWLLLAVALCALATVAGACAFNALAPPRITVTRGWWHHLP